MKQKSIRRRLPLSYAAIALLAALSLGSIMLLVLNSYYTNQEKAYLFGNGQALQSLTEKALSENTPLDNLQDTVQVMAFLSQTRIQIIDQEKKTIVDTGVPDTNQVIAVARSFPNTTISTNPAPVDEDQVIVVGNTATSEKISAFGIFQTPVTLKEEGPVISIEASPYGYEFVTTEITSIQKTSDEKRSSQVVKIPLSNNKGTLILSNGPAYGRDIITSVTWAWGIAGLIAVLIAGFVGWFASKQVTDPVLALSKATSLMKQGDLSTRVKLSGNHSTFEFDTLASSFNEMAQRIENTVSTLQTFVADAAHELHTPLTALHTNLELAVDEQDPAIRTQYMISAQEQSRRLEGLVSGLLDLSRIEAAGTTSVKTHLNLSILIQQISNQFASRAEMLGQTFILDLPSEPIEIHSNEMQLRRILGNLLENALKFTPSGGIVSLLTSIENNQIIVKVKDTGIGIPEEDLPNLFDRFHRGRNASRYPGNGLGLAIVKALAEIQGGSVSAESELGLGTTMTVNLPIENN